MMWDFADEKSINARFAEATASGESVVWTVLPVGGSILTFTGTWWFSSEAGSYPRASTAMGWSSDDGSWQARDGCSNGAGDTHGSVCPWGHHNGGGWGQGNWGARDAGTAAWNCGYLYTGSVNATRGGKSLLLIKVALALTRALTTGPEPPNPTRTATHNRKPKPSPSPSNPNTLCP